MKTIPFRLSSKAVMPPSLREADGTIYVRGFASMKSPDRHGDVIDPMMFDIEQFRNNPQLFVNHRQWKRADGNGVNAGMVEQIYAVRVERVKESDDADPDYNVIDARTNDIVATIKNSEGYAVSDGDLGLWVVAHVMEPDVVDLVEQRRLNSFSWHGSVFEKSSTGEIVNIDLREVSLVNIPAGQRALFTVGKMAFEALTGAFVALEGNHAYLIEEEPATLVRTDTAPRFAVAVKDRMSEYVTFLEGRAVRTLEEAMVWASKVANATAVVVLESTGHETSNGMLVYRIPDGGVLDVTVAEKDEADMYNTNKMSNEDRDLFSRLADIKKSAGASPDDTLETKGGEHEMNDEDRKLLREVAKGVATIGEQQEQLAKTSAELATRVEAIEAAKSEAKSEEDTKTEAQSDKTKEAAVATPPANEDKPKEEAAAKSQDDNGKDDETSALLRDIAKSVADLSKGLNDITDSHKKLAERVESIEEKPAEKSAASDDDADDIAEKAASKFAELEPAKQHRVRRGALSRVMIPTNVVSR